MTEENGCLFNRANQGRVGDKKYLVSAIWWRQWCDYVNFDVKPEDGNNIAFKLNNNMLIDPPPPPGG